MKINKIFILIFCVLFLSSCSIIETKVYVRGYYPIIKKPKRPKLPIITKKDIENNSKKTAYKLVNTVKDLEIYSKKLEKSIDTYNEFAIQENKKIDEIISK